MIGIFDSGIGGLTVLRKLASRFKAVHFLYLGDHAHMPYGNRPSRDIVDLTRAGVELLFRRGARLVILGCNTATAIAARSLQREWLPGSPWRGHNVIGIVAPTVEAATQTPWAVTSPQYPQKYNTDVIAVFGTERTIASGVYAEEIRKRCPRVTVLQQACPELAGAIERQALPREIDRLVEAGVSGVLRQTSEQMPHRAILGCTHFPIVADRFRRYLPAATRLLSQPEAVADSLEDYLARHPEYLDPGERPGVTLLTTGEAASVNRAARVFWPDAPAFASAQ